mmetsp:Transcript_18544/g.31056  ORF Transcript_18544/g.31056 Transcript_18544/m.31056 type:complete len:804 (-) Transcript_18544:1053-3464(-)
MGGSSSKSTFSNIVGKILVSDIDPSDHDFWDEMWKTVLPAEDVFDMISPEDVRKIISDHPNNMKTIVTQAVAQLYQVVETPYRIYFEQALNCSRIMARLLPFLLESSSAEMKDLLWNRRAPSQQVSSENLAADSRDMGSEGEDADPQASEPLAVILVNTIFHLLFLPDFTVDDPNVEFTEKDINTPEFKSALMWAPGIGSSEKTIVNSTQFDHNRIDVLRLMICAFCDSLYQAADNYDSCASMWLEVATSADAPYAEIVFYSLFNTVLGYDPIGWGLPYGSMITTDTAKLVMEAAVQVLIALLDYGHPIRTAESSAAAAAAVAEGSNPLPSVSAHDTEAQGFNIFRCLLGKIEAPDQLNFVYRGFVRLLNNVHQAESTFLPHSVTRIDIEQELLVLFWKCLEEMPKFMPYILMHCDATELLVPICYLMLQGRRDPTKVGLMYLCTFTLLKLSGERTFGVALNKPYQLHLPVDLPLFSGNHADLLVVVLHKLIVSGQEKLSALYSCFLTIICNISPYIKSFGTVASVKLVNLLQLFVSPRFLYAAEGNHVYVSMLLETLNNIVQYQYEGNGQLIYAIIRRKEVFDSIANLKLPASAAAAAAAAPTVVLPSLQIGCSSWDRCVRPGFLIADAVANVTTHFVTLAYSLPMIATGSIGLVYSSHTLEHLSYNLPPRTTCAHYPQSDETVPGCANEVDTALQEWRRVLVAGGQLLVGVPDLQAIASFFIETKSHREKNIAQQILHGGQINQFDVHKTGFHFGYLKQLLDRHGFCNVTQVDEFGLFRDASRTTFYFGKSISLNVQATAC